MAAKKQTLEDSLTFVMEKEDTSYKGPTVTIYLPKLEDEVAKCPSGKAGGVVGKDGARKHGAFDAARGD